MTILLAGATGLVGGEVLRLLHERGHHVRTLSRDAAQAPRLLVFTADARFADATEPGALAGMCDGIEVVISTLGAPVAQKARETRSFDEIDVLANVLLLREAERAGVKHFIYLSAAHDDATRDTAYIRAHVAVEKTLHASRIPATFVRPTGVFGAFGELADMAKKGPLPLIGDGTAKTNPIHERDVAEAIVGALEPPVGAPRVVDIGGPETLTREELALQIYRSVGKKPRLIRIPRWFMAFGATMLRMLNRRNGDFLRFIVAASTHASIAPVVGTRRFSDYFSART
ncbi:MAG TPA: SDR family oxidoreductase [Kofleriaceae bacterium]